MVACNILATILWYQKFSSNTQNDYIVNVERGNDNDKVLINLINIKNNTLVVFLHRKLILTIIGKTSKKIICILLK